MKKIIVEDKWSIMIISFCEWPSLKKSFLGEQAFHHEGYKNASV